MQSQFSLVSLTLSVVAFSISCRYRIHPDLLVGLMALVVGTLTYPSLSVVLTDAISRLMKFGFGVKTALLPDFTPQRNLTSTLELSDNLQTTNLLKMGLIPLSSARIHQWKF